jgi:hypothetical protein
LELHRADADAQLPDTSSPNPRMQLVAGEPVETVEDIRGAAESGERIGIGLETGSIEVSRQRIVSATSAFCQAMGRGIVIDSDL